MMITAATLADVDALCSLVNAAYRGDGGQTGWTSEAGLVNGKRTNLAALREMLTQGQATVLLLRQQAGDALIGCIAVQHQVDSCWYISMLAVDPQQQAAGLGRVLLTEAENYARQRGATSAKMTVVQVRESLIAWYERRGYQRTGEIEPFPYEDESVGKPLRGDLHFVVLEKAL
jgi:ribosomal protein S18 acetylase RimI-like enzyme